MTSPHSVLQSVPYLAAEALHHAMKLQPRAVEWRLANQRSCVSFPIFHFQKPKLGEGNLLGERFIWLRKIGDIEGSHVSEQDFNRLIRQRGICYGVAMALVSLAAQQPNTPLLQLLQQIKRDPQLAIAYQVMEIVRPIIPAGVAVETPFWIDVPDTTLAFDLSNCSSEDIASHLQELSECGLIIRTWSGGGQDSHSSCIWSSNVNHQHWFYNSRWVGAFSYPSHKELVIAFIAHLHVHAVAALQPEGHVAIERFSLLHL